MIFSICGIVSGITGGGKSFSTGTASVVFFSSTTTCDCVTAGAFVTGGGTDFGPWMTPPVLSRVDRRFAGTGSPLPNVPGGRGNVDRPNEPGAAGDGKIPALSDVNRFPLLLGIDGGSCGGPGGTGTAGTANESFRTGLPNVETRGSTSLFFAGRRSISVVSFRFFAGDFARRPVRVIVKSDLMVKDSFSTRFVGN